MKIKPVVVALQLALAVGSLHATSVIAAEDNSNASDQQNNQQESPQAKAETIQITGTRIRRENFSTPTPLVSINREAIVDSGTGALA